MKLSRAARRESGATVLRVLGHPARLHVIELLARESLTVSELAERAELTSGTVSKHLRELASVELVMRRQEGNFARYSLTDRDVARLVAIAYRQVEAQAGQRQLIADLTSPRPPRGVA